MNINATSPSAATQRFHEMLSSASFPRMHITADMLSSFNAILQRIPLECDIFYFNWESGKSVFAFHDTIFENSAFTSWKKTIIPAGILTTLESHLDMLMQSFHMTIIHQLMLKGWRYGPTYSKEDKTLPEFVALSDLTKASDPWTLKYLDELKGLTARVVNRMSYYLLKDAKAPANAYAPVEYAKLVRQSAPGYHPFKDNFFKKIHNLATREQRDVEINFPEHFFWTPSNSIYHLVNMNFPEELVRSELTISEGAVATHTAQLDMLLEGLHLTILARLMEEGWKPGESFDKEAKTLPELVPFSELLKGNNTTHFYRCILQNLAAEIHFYITACILNNYGKKPEA